MLKYNADEQQPEPIEITLEGKTYTVVSLTTETMKKISALNTAEKNIDTLAAQLGILLDVKPEIFLKMNMRKLAGAVQFLSAELNKSFENIGKPPKKE